MADRPTYTTPQLEAYFERIGLPQAQRRFSVSSLSDEEKLAYLTRLQKHQIITVPFENLTLHYSWHRVINVRPAHLYNKIVAPPSRRGGYCMEANTLFHTVLRALGFDLYLAGARVRHPDTGRYGGFSHCVNLVRIGDTKYMVDVAFGANEPVAPLPLVVGREHGHVGPARVRLVHEAIPQNLDQECRLWIYQFQVDEHAAWTPMYCFVDFEFLPEDIQGMNLAPWRSPASWFTQKLVVVRFTTTAEADAGDGAGPGSAATERTLAGGDADVDGVLIMDHDRLKWRRAGVTVMERQLVTDDERVEALKRYWGIELSEEDREAIRGTVGEIKA